VSLPLNENKKVRRNGKKSAITTHLTKSKKYRTAHAADFRQPKQKRPHDSNSPKRKALLKHAKINAKILVA